MVLVIVGMADDGYVDVPVAMGGVTAQPITYFHSDDHRLHDNQWRRCCQAGAASHPPYDIVTSLPDGRRAVLTANDRYYVVRDDGWPDWDQPVHRDGDLIIR